MVVDVITLFPEVFEGPASVSIIQRARERGLLDLRIHDLRSYATGRHRTTDDYPYGGGAGMVMRPEPLFRAVRAVRDLGPVEPYVVFLTPSGERFTQRLAGLLSCAERLILVCGRYEGFDERVFALADMCVSIGDYVLTGGEVPALVVIEATARLIPGVLGHERSAADESFAEGLLEYPQFTRPASFEGMTVPDVLLSGNHAEIAAFRRREAIMRTARVRPDLLTDAVLTPEEHALARTERERSHPGERS